MERVWLGVINWTGLHIYDLDAPFRGEDDAVQKRASSPPSRLLVRLALRRPEADV